jgi:hypothetical protein
MAAPDAADIPWRPGTNGVPTDDSSAIIGAIDTGEELVADAEGQIIAAGEADVAGGSARVHYGGGYVSNEEGAGGSLTVGKLCLANGGLPMPAQGQIVITDPTGENEGLEIRVTGMVDGVQVVEELTITTGAAETDALFDSGSHWWAQTIDAAAIAGVNGTDDLVVSVGATTVAVMRAPLADHWATGCKTVGSLYQISMTTSLNVTLSAANRLTAPTATGGMEAYTSGILVSGDDDRLTIGTLADTDYRGIALKRTIPAGMSRMPEGGLPHVFWLTGTAEA